MKLVLVGLISLFLVACSANNPNPILPPKYTEQQQFFEYVLQYNSLQNEVLKYVQRPYCTEEIFSNCKNKDTESKLVAASNAATEVFRRAIYSNALNKTIQTDELAATLKNLTLQFQLAVTGDK